MKFKVGELVKYTSDKWIRGPRNPLWGGEYGRLVGVITSVKEDKYSEIWINVSWPNGEENDYIEEDLEWASEEEAMLYKLRK